MNLFKALGRQATRFWRWFKQAKLWQKVGVVFAGLILLGAAAGLGQKKNVEVAETESTVTATEATVIAPTEVPVVETTMATAQVNETEAGRSTEPPGTVAITAPALIMNCKGIEEDCPFEAFLRDRLRDKTDDKTLEVIVDDTTNPDVPTVGVTVGYKDNITKGISESGTRHRAVDILQFVQANAPGREVRISVKADLVSKLGEELNGVFVLSAFYSPEVVQRINFDGFNRDNIFSVDVADIRVINKNVGCGLTDAC